MTDGAGLVFDRVAAEYDRVRPSYPDLLVDAACSAAGLRTGSRVVEVGCGTGKLTTALVARGLEVEAVDPSPQLVAIAQRGVPEARLRFHVCSLEDVNLPLGGFEAVLSATAFHWVDPAVGWGKAARLLRPGGTLALLEHVSGMTELDAQWLAAWADVLPEAATWVLRDDKSLWDGAEARRENVSEVWAWLSKREIARPEAAEFFGPAEVRTMENHSEQTVEESLALLRTTSAYIRLDPERRRRLERNVRGVFARSGGTIPSKTFATLVTARVRA